MNKDQKLYYINPSLEYIVISSEKGFAESEENGGELDLEDFN